jgi:hypothetical protein
LSLKRIDDDIALSRNWTISPVVKELVEKRLAKLSMSRISEMKRTRSLFRAVVDWASDAENNKRNGDEFYLLGVNNI